MLRTKPRWSLPEITQIRSCVMKLWEVKCNGLVFGPPCLWCCHLKWAFAVFLPECKAEANVSFILSLNLSVWSEVQMICIWFSWCQCQPIISCSSKIQNGLPFWCRLTEVVPEKRPLNGCSVVVVSSLTVQNLSECCQHDMFCVDSSWRWCVPSTNDRWRTRRT